MGHGNTRRASHRSSEHSAHTLGLFIQRRSNYPLWVAIVFGIACVGYIAISDIGSTESESIHSMQPKSLMNANHAPEPAIQVLANAKQTQTLERDQSSATIAKARPKVLVDVKPGDSLNKILRGQGFSARDVYAIAEKMQAAGANITIYPGEQFEFETDLDGIASSFTANTNDHRIVTVTREEDDFDLAITAKPKQTAEIFTSVSIDNSLFYDASQAGLSDRLIMELAQLFQWEIDFALDIRQGDSFRVIFEESTIDGQKIGNGPILAAEFNTRGRTIRGYRYEHSDGTIGYYDEDGESLRKAFLKAPVDFARISSKFSLARRHPVLHRIRAHKGVDYAAATGTPVKSTGRGKVSFVGRKGGYGNTVVIQHNQEQSTLYAHLNSFAAGLKQGQRVQQGDVIGTIGSTGLATGPHLHYEFRRNGVQIDPLKIKAPKAVYLAEAEQTRFKSQISELQGNLKRFPIDHVAMLTTDAVTP